MVSAGMGEILPDFVIEPAIQWERMMVISICFVSIHPSCGVLNVGWVD
jgi:hypothetical protein